MTDGTRVRAEAVGEHEGHQHRDEQRDLTNSPLQSVELTVALLKTRHPESQAQLERLERQLARLRQLSVVLSQYEPQRWAPGDGSFDPLEVLQSPEK